MPRRRPALAVLVLAACLAAASPTRAFVEYGPIVHPDSGHAYSLLAINTWQAAEAEAQALGGHLVAIGDAEENAWVWSTFGTLAGGPAWIGMNDAAQEGDYVWTNGEPYLFYDGWWTAGGEPNDAGGNEDYAEINNGVWADVGGFGPNPAIVEVEDDPYLTLIDVDTVPAATGSGSLYGIAVSPDGEHVYVVHDVSIGDDDIVAYTRAGDGSLDFLAAWHGPGNPNAMAMAPDGSALFVAGNNGEIEAWRRDGATGLLSYADEVYDGNPGATSLQGPTALAVAPNGRQLYVASSENAVTTLAWDGATGDLAPIDTDLSGAGGVPLVSPSAVVATPDGAFVIAVSRGDTSLVVYARDPVSGTITVAQRLVNGVGGVTGMVFPSTATVVPASDGASVYVTAFAPNLVHFAAVASGPASGVAFVEAPPAGLFSGPTAPSPDGALLYMSDSRGLHALVRDPATGALGGFSDSAFTTDSPSDGFDAAGAIAASADGRSVYTIGRESIAAFATPVPEPGAGALALAALAGLGAITRRRSPAAPPRPCACARRRR